MKKKIILFVRVIVSAGLIGLLLWLMRGDLKNIVSIIAKCQLKFILMAAIVMLANIISLAYRMKVIFVGEDLNISLMRSMQLTFIGYFFNNFMPTAVGGDIVKAHCASVLNGKKLQSYASVLMDRILGLYTFLIVASAALLIYRGEVQLATIKVILSFCLVLGIVMFIIVTEPRIVASIERFLIRIKSLRLGERLHAAYKIICDYKNRKDVVLKSIITSIAGQCLHFFAIYLFFRSLGVEVHIGDIFLIMPIVSFVSMLPSIGGLGLREGAIVAFFTPVVGREISFAMSILYLAGLFVIGLIGGIIYLWWSLKGYHLKIEE
ncbi:MAG: lysylphosphatidylglycerol synthase transmembrane domain-containing protein [Candidatus Omnitrophica bacterium]|nr:lysylphosphatidylglycerol synthase transmembrane domain-containing protein [Candidatus Omnitrophota bacterium]